MINRAYVTTLNKYIESKERAKSATAGKGLLSPTKKDKAISKQERDATAIVGDFIYTLRKKTKELKGNKDAA